MKLIAVFAAIAFSASIAQAKPHHEGPCKKIIEACQSAGFQKGQHKATGKGLYIDCMKKIMNGETVAGVTVDANEVTACKAAKAKHQARKGHK